VPAAGVPLAALTALGMRALLYGVAPLDPHTLAVVALTVVAAAAVASWLPARQAARIDPNEVLRAE
jgi:ABC-type lipoprotein release transport system permease subunit